MITKQLTAMIESEHDDHASHCTESTSTGNAGPIEETSVNLQEAGYLAILQ